MITERTRETDAPAETPDERVGQLLRRFNASSVCAAELLCDGHDQHAVAFTIAGADGEYVDIGYGELRTRSAALAAGLAAQGIGPGDRVATLMGKSEELVVTMMAVWRLGAVYVPLFTAFGPGAIALRLERSDAKLVVVDESQRSKLEPGAEIPAAPPWRIAVHGRVRHDGDLSLRALRSGDPATVQPFRGTPDTPLVQLFTSGTTGSPKGVIHPIRSLAPFVAYQELAYYVTADDVFWNAADPGWAYGLYYAILGPLASARRSVLLAATFSAETTWRVLRDLRVTNFAAAPTVLRAMRNAVDEIPDGIALRRISTAGEPLTADVFDWTRSALGIEIHDHYGQTEVGMVAAQTWDPRLSDIVRPGSFGRSLPGWTLAVLDEHDQPVPAGTLGELAIDAPNSPLMTFAGYAGAPEATAKRFSADGRWYRTGDLVTMDAEGRYSFASRDDDLILMAGYRIAPYDVEGVLLKHDRVRDAAVVGVPDELRGEVIEAFVVTGEAVDAEAFEQELRRFVKERYSAHVAPARVHVVDALPRTPSGKVQRHLLRAQRGAESQP